MARSHDIRPRTATDMRHPTLQARSMVMDAANEYLSDGDKLEDLEDVYVVQFCYILGGWKAMISTTVPDDKYYEVTHKAAGETFVDVYEKIRNKVISVDDPVHNL